MGTGIRPAVASGATGQAADWRGAQALPSYARLSIASGGDDRLIDDIYDAAADPTRWDATLSSLADRVGGASCIFVGHRAERWGTPQFGHFGRLDPEINLRASRQDFAESPFAARLATLAQGELACSDAIAAPCSFQRTAWYRDVLAPQHIGSCLMTPLVRGRDFFGAFFAARDVMHGTFDDADVARFGSFIPHLRRAAELRCRVDAFDRIAASQRDALDAIEIGIILIDETGKARAANSAAETMLRDGKAMRLAGNALAVSDRQNAGRLDGLIAATAAGGAGGTMALRRKGSGQPLVVLVCPLRGALRDKFSRSTEARQTVALFVKDPTDAGAGAEDAMADFYGLTPGETRIAGALAEGCGIAGAAQGLGLSENTVKMHARRVFEKTGVSGQVELARFFAQFSAPVRIGHAA